MSLEIKTQDCYFSCVVGLMDDACEVLCCTATKKSLVETMQLRGDTCAVYRLQVYILFL